HPIPTRRSSDLAHHSQGDWLDKGEQDDEWNRANKVHQHVQHGVNHAVFQDTRRARGVEQDTNEQPQNARHQHGDNDHDEGVWDRLGSTLTTAIQDTLIMVIVTMLVAGILGLFIGILLYTTRPSGILKNRVVYTVLNVLVNFVRPIPFIILLAFVQPVTLAVMGTSIGRNPATFVMAIAATFAVARIVEQNLVAIDP